MPIWKSNNIIHNYIIFTILLGVIVAIFIYKPEETAAGWYQSGGVWINRKSITIDHTKVQSTDQTNFPVLIDLTDSNLASTARSDGGDILFTSSDGTTKLDHEIELYTSATGRLTAWVRIPTLSTSVDTVIYMYFGNGAADVQANPTGVWDADYRIVQHMKETSGTILDSTSYGNNGTNTGGAVSTASSKIGNGYNVVDGDDNRIQTPYNSSWSSAFNGYTVQAWIRVVSSGDFRGLFAVGAWNQNLFVWLYGNSVMTSYITTSVNGQFAVSPGNPGDTFPIDGNFHHLVLTYNSALGTASLYIDGVLENNVTGKSGTINLGTRNIAVGNFADSDFAYTGGLDELRVSSVGRSADWIRTEYNNQSATSTFYTLSSSQTSDPPALKTKVRGGGSGPTIKVRGGSSEGVKFR